MKLTIPPYIERIHVKQSKVFLLLVNLFLAFFICSFQTLFAQQKTVTGTAYSYENKPLQRASIAAEGSNISTISNADGSYRLELYATDNILLFSYVGFATERKTINEPGSIDVILTLNLRSLIV